MYVPHRHGADPRRPRARAVLPPRPLQAPARHDVLRDVQDLRRVLHRGRGRRVGRGHVRARGRVEHAQGRVRPRSCPSGYFGGFRLLLSSFGAAAVVTYV